MPSNSLIFELETYRGGIETWSGFTELARSEAPLFEVWECDFTAYKKALKSGGDAALKYYQHDRRASMTPAEMITMGAPAAPLTLTLTLILTRTRHPWGVSLFFSTSPFEVGSKPLSMSTKPTAKPMARPASPRPMRPDSAPAARPASSSSAATAKKPKAKKPKAPPQAPSAGALRPRVGDPTLVISNIEQLSEVQAKAQLGELQKKYGALIVNFNNQQAELATSQKRLAAAEQRTVAMEQLQRGERGADGADPLQEQLQSTLAVRHRLLLAALCAPSTQRTCFCVHLSACSWLYLNPHSRPCSVQWLHVP